eukprot:NODE_175_length_2903_cov_30.718641_g159_i0.p1 GENE.NODE_175_length_2903_cov_30.718641_g159_i0~~NODE_175_length_2903_cov_30.718641_g159_i0.p1  ORF type:complete len:920 (+),score=178.50 NODE_175_length_2903_cov_30.718641_g159_i0:117-2876(+)
MHANWREQTHIDAETSVLDVLKSLNMARSSGGASYTLYSAAFAAIARERQSKPALQLGLDALCWMREDGLVPDVAIYNSLISQAAASRDSETALLLLDQMEMETQANGETFLYLAQACRHNAQRALEILASGRERRLKLSVEVHNAVLEACCVIGDGVHAIRVLNALASDAIQPDEQTAALLQNLAPPGISKARFVHGILKNAGLRASAAVFHTLVNESESVSAALELVFEMRQLGVAVETAAMVALFERVSRALPKEVAACVPSLLFIAEECESLLDDAMRSTVDGWALEIQKSLSDPATGTAFEVRARLLVFSHSGDCSMAYQVLKESRSSSRLECKLNLETYALVFAAIRRCIANSKLALQLGLDALCWMREDGLVPDVAIYNSLISQAAASRDSETALLLLDQMEMETQANGETFLYLAQACRHNAQRALEVLHNGRQRREFQLPVAFYNAVLEACCSIGDSVHAVRILGNMALDGVKPDEYTALHLEALTQMGGATSGSEFTRQMLQNVGLAVPAAVYHAIISDTSSLPESLDFISTMQELSVPVTTATFNALFAAASRTTANGKRIPSTLLNDLAKCLATHGFVADKNSELLLEWCPFLASTIASHNRKRKGMKRRLDGTPTETAVCRNFLTGGCHYSSRCRFLHPLGPLQGSSLEATAISGSSEVNLTPNPRFVIGTLQNADELSTALTRNFITGYNEQTLCCCPDEFTVALRAINHSRDELRSLHKVEFQVTAESVWSSSRYGELDILFHVVLSREVAREADNVRHDRVMAVSKGTNEGKLGGAIAHVLKSQHALVLRAIGSSSVVQAVKGLALARRYIKNDCGRQAELAFLPRRIFLRVNESEDGGEQEMVLDPATTSSQCPACGVQNQVGSRSCAACSSPLRDDDLYIGWEFMVTGQNCSALSGKEEQK